MDKEVVAVAKKADKYFVVLEDDSRVQVDPKEFQRVKKLLSKGGTIFLEENEESNCVE